MINSQYILDILNLLLDDHPESDLLKKQIPLLTISGRTHTGFGEFINFSAKEQIQELKLRTFNSRTFDTEGNPISMLDGLEIKNAELSILAEAIIHLKNGIIDHLEIWNKCGLEYVQNDPEHYQLEQSWIEPNKRRTIIR